MASSLHKVNTCRDIVPYVPLVPIIGSSEIVNDVGTMIVPQQPVGRKTRLVTSIVTGRNLVHFVIVPSKGEANIYTIKPNEFYSHESKCRMCQSIVEVRRHIFQGEKLKVEVDPITNAVIVSVVEVAEKRSKKRKGESSISERESAAKKHKSNVHDKYDDIEECIEVFRDLTRRKGARGTKRNQGRINVSTHSKTSEKWPGERGLAPLLQSKQWCEFVLLSGNLKACSTPQNQGVARVWLLI